MEPETREPVEIDPRKFWISIAVICAVIIFGSVFVTRSYLKRSEYEAQNPRPYMIGKLEKDLTAINRDGREVSLSELKGKIWVASSQFTDCPKGCIRVSHHLKEIFEKFDDVEDFHVVIFSLNASEDTPEKMNQFVKVNGIDKPNWWFLTGDQDEIRKYLVRYFRFFGVVENLDPAIIATEGKYQHDLRLAVVDGKANVRGIYSPTHPDWGDKDMERILHDVEYLLDEAGKQPETGDPATTPATATPDAPAEATAP